MSDCFCIAHCVVVVVVVQLAVNNENRFVVRFLFESILNELLPQWLPAASAFAMVLAVYWALDYFSPLYGLVASWALYAGTTFALFQWQLIDLRGRAIMGMFTGFIALLFGAYYAVLAPRLHSLVNLYQLVLALLMVYLVYKIYTIRPLGTKCENRSVLAAQIVYLAPSEGTDEETAELCRQQGRDRDSIGRLGVSRLCHLHADTASANSAAAGSAAAASAAAAVPLRKKGGTRFVRDKFTGQVRRVDVEELDPMDELEGQALLGGGNSSGGGGSSSSSSSAGLIRNSSGGHGGGEDDCDEAMRLLQSPGLRCRTLGPNICGHCVADRRYIVKPHMHPDVLKLLRRVGAMEDEPNWLLQKLGFQFAQEHAHNPDEILSIATHCLQCGACVLDQDHHSSLLGSVSAAAA